MVGKPGAKAGLFLLTRLLFLYARVPGFVLSVCIAEPSLAGRAVHCCGIITWLIVG
jgi:hypothetical protein